MASSEPIMLPPVAGCDNNGGGGDEGGADFQFIDFDECSLEDRTNLCRILDMKERAHESCLDNGHEGADGGGPPPLMNGGHVMPPPHPPSQSQAASSALPPQSVASMVPLMAASIPPPVMSTTVQMSVVNDAVTSAAMGMSSAYGVPHPQQQPLNQHSRHMIHPHHHHQHHNQQPPQQQQQPPHPPGPPPSMAPGGLASAASTSPYFPAAAAAAATSFNQSYLPTPAAAAAAMAMYQQYPPAMPPFGAAAGFTPQQQGQQAQQQAAFMQFAAAMQAMQGARPPHPQSQVPIQPPPPLNLPPPLPPPPPQQQQQQQHQPAQPHPIPVISTQPHPVQQHHVSVQELPVVPAEPHRQQQQQHQQQHHHQQVSPAVSHPTPMSSPRAPSSEGESRANAAGAAEFPVHAAFSPPSSVPPEVSTLSPTLAASSPPEPANPSDCEAVEDTFDPEEDCQEAAIPPEPAAPPAPKSWASLFHKPAPVAPVDTSVHSRNAASPSDGSRTPIPGSAVGGVSDSLDNGESEGGPDSSAGEHMGVADTPLSKFLREYDLNHRSPSLRPRGLTNRSNWCFANAVLQALIACPPFYNLMKSLPLDPTPAEAKTGGAAERQRQSLKVVRAAYEFVSEFEVVANFPKLNNKNKSKKVDDLPLGKNFEPNTVYNALSKASTADSFGHGRQEDAEEFLLMLLNGLTDEMQAILKPQAAVSAENGDLAEGGEEEEDGDDDEWKEVGPKNKGVITRRQGNPDSARTPIESIFCGQSRSSVHHATGEPTATLQPFFTLQLDIQGESTKSVSDALTAYFSTESLDGYVCSTTKKEVEAKRSLSLEELPPILILALKRFVYSETSGGCQKVLKAVDFPIDLEVPHSVLSPNSRSRYQAKKRQYKLFAVVNHNGIEATKGHYVTNVYHTGLAGWLNYDDGLIKAVGEKDVLHQYTTNSVPYILWYRRGDTKAASGPDKQNSK